MPLPSICLHHFKLIEMAGLFASMAVKWALEKLSSMLPSPALASSSRTTQDLDELRRLERAMKRIHATLDDAENHWNIRDESVKLRLKELKELAYDAEDVVDEYQYEVTRHRVEEDAKARASSSNKRKRQDQVNEESSIDADIVPVPYDLAVRTKKILERFHDIKDYAAHFSLSENDGERRADPDIQSMRQTSSVISKDPKQRILGREQDKNKVIAKLLSEEDCNNGSPVSVLAIVGMGGSGKTTLAQLVYNDQSVHQSFDVHAWVCVSEQFDVNSITRNIIGSARKEECDGTQLDTLQRELVKKIEGKRFLLVLDDVWNERRDCWEQLCAPLWSARLCQIILTTRSEVVTRVAHTVSLYKLGCLNPDDSWSLFEQAAFVDHQQDVGRSNLVQIGEKIVDKCKGLPLAIKTLGSMLRYEADEERWEDVLKSELWGLEQPQKEVLPALELSYKHMPKDLKRCFVALSLFRKDYRLYEHEVVLLWEALGLLPHDRRKNKHQIGISYFDKLLQRSMLQVDSLDGCCMHDLTHDLACYLAGEEFFRLELNSGPTEISQNARYMLIIRTPTSFDWRRRSIRISNASDSLRAIIVMTHVEVPEALFSNFEKLRTFSLLDSFCSTFRLLDGTCTEGTLPYTMGNLKLLRYLRINPHLKLPQSLFNLFNLHTLELSYYDEDYQPWMRSEKALSHYKEYRPALSEIGRLVNLQMLPTRTFDNGNSSSNIRQLRNMNKIRELYIRGSKSVTNVDDAKEANLQSKKHLQFLDLDFYFFQDTQMQHHPDMQQFEYVTISHAKLLENLQPHNNIRELSIKHYKCQIYPSWLGNASFSMLTKISLSCSEVKCLPTLGELPSLKSLEILSMDSVECVGREFCSLDPRVEGFRSLKCLSFKWMSKWSEWSGAKDGDFSCLQTLSIFSADELRSIPLVLFASLVSLELFVCRNLVAIPTSPTLHKLCLHSCYSLNELPTLPSLCTLEVNDCPSLCTIGHLPSLTTMHLVGPFEEEALSNLVNVHLSLKCLTISSKSPTCISLVPQSLPSLAVLKLCCPNLQYCDGLAGLTSLKELRVWSCPNLHLQNLVPGQLQTLDVQDELGSSFTNLSIIDRSSQTYYLSNRLGITMVPKRPYYI